MPFTTTDAVNFLKTNRALASLNFALRTFKVYPSAYQKDVADAIKSGDIAIHLSGASTPAAAATYYTDFDSLDVAPSFNIAAWTDQAYFVHECTHAHIDIQNLGAHSGHENEAVAYLAEAMFLELSGMPPLGTQPTRIVSHHVAKMMLAEKRYAVLPSEAVTLVSEVSKEPIYKTKIHYISNGFERSLVERWFR